MVTQCAIAVSSRFQQELPMPTALPRLLILLLTCAPALSVPLEAASAAASASQSGAADAALMRLADSYFDQFYFPNNPSTATAEGIHRYDSQLEDYSRAAVERQTRALHEYERRFDAIGPERLSEQVRGDRELLLASIRSTLLALQTIRSWEKNPDSYSSGITASAYTLMERNFAPATDRLRLLIARERQMPAALAAARSNLNNPPQILTQIAIEQLPGDISFFRTDLPSAFAGADPGVAAEFARVNAQVIAALQSYQEWLSHELLPRAHGEFRLGPQVFRDKLRYDEMVDVPLERLLAIGTADLRRNQAEFARVAKQLEPDKSARQVLSELAADYPAPDRLLDEFRATFSSLIAFIEQHQIIGIPSTVRPIVRETPPFMRATTFASMDTPGPYEKVANEAYFNVTLPEPSWSKERTAGFMAQFSYPVISNVAVHEAYPGHYIQFLWAQRLDDRVRKLLGAASNAEGWAHYCEQMMLDEGYGEFRAGADKPREVLRLRLGQLQDALLRDARYIVAIKLHTQQMSLPEAIDFFVQEGYQSREVGETETKRGTGDPTYLYYTLGKLQIMKLRSDLAAREGSAFQLKAFHDAFMQQGFPPIKIVRRALLGDDSPTL
jgi:uncharacterized protein (DUF885 family)